MRFCGLWSNLLWNYKATPESLCLEGVALHEQAKYSEAVEKFDQCLAKDSQNVEAWYNRGNSLVSLEKYEEAITSYDQAILFKPNYHEAWNNRGVSLAYLGLHEEAIASYDRAIEIRPDEHGAWYYRGISLKKLAEDWHRQGLEAFDRSDYPTALELWQKTFQTIHQEKLSNSSQLIQQFLDEQLLFKFLQPPVQNILPQILAIYTTNDLLSELGVALVRNLQALQAPTISDYTADQWQTWGRDYPDLTLSLDMLAAGVQHKKTPQDGRIFLRLPSEMRPLLREALGLPIDP